MLNASEYTERLNEVVDSSGGEAIQIFTLTISDKHIIMCSLSFLLRNFPLLTVVPTLSKECNRWPSLQQLVLSVPF